MDFELVGNSNNVSHLIKKRPNGMPNQAMLNFELNLRQLKNRTTFKATQPFVWPQAQRKIPVEV
jgi:hypothetical protein